MNTEETRIRILLKIDEVIPALATNRDPEFNEQVSCVICNLASAYKDLDQQKINRRLKAYEDTGLTPEEIERLKRFVLGREAGDTDA